MPDWLRIILAVLVIAVLIAVFITSYLLYKKTPVPKGCEDIHPNEEKCHGCNQTECHFNLYYNSDRIEKAGKEEKREESEDGKGKEK